MFITRVLMRLTSNAFSLRWDDEVASCEWNLCEYKKSSLSSCLLLLNKLMLHLSYSHKFYLGGNWNFPCSRRLFGRLSLKYKEFLVPELAVAAHQRTDFNFSFRCLLVVFFTCVVQTSVMAHNVRRWKRLNERKLYWGIILYDSFFLLIISHLD